MEALRSTIGVEAGVCAWWWSGRIAQSGLMKNRLHYSGVKRAGRGWTNGRRKRLGGGGRPGFEGRGKGCAVYRASRLEGPLKDPK